MFISFLTDEKLLNVVGNIVVIGVLSSIIATLPFIKLEITVLGEEVKNVKGTYELLLKTLFEKSRKQCYDIIYSFSMYQSIGKSIFENSYYNFFNYEHNERGTSIINEIEPINKVYIIRNGDCSLSTYKSIYELNELIIIYKNYLGIPSTYEEQQNEEFLLSKNFKSNLFREFVFEKKRVNVIKINNRDVLGLDDMLIGKVDNVPHFTVNCESSICEYYTIDKKNYDILYSREKSISLKKTAEKVIKDWTHTRNPMHEFFLRGPQGGLQSYRSRYSALTP